MIKSTRILMGMPITVEVLGSDDQAPLESVFAHFTRVDERFSTYKETSEISAINAGRLRPEEASPEMRAILVMAEQTRRETDGYFNIWRDGRYDPAGIVKGWAIAGAAEILRRAGCANFYVDAGGDIEVAGLNDEGLPWRVGIRNPFNIRQIVKVLAISGCGVATSGTSIRGQHIYDPHAPGRLIDEIVSLTVVGPNIYEADRFATAAFAMGQRGIFFIERLAGFEGYMIDVELGEGLGAAAIAPSDLVIMVGNLLDNAIKYGPEGGAIRLTAERRAGQLEIAVSDDGPGIPPEDLPRVQERFFRVNRAHARDIPGSGLGLALVAAVAQQYGGVLLMSSSGLPGEGTCARLRLPARADVLAEAWADVTPSEIGL